MRGTARPPCQHAAWSCWPQQEESWKKTRCCGVVEHKTAVAQDATLLFLCYLEVEGCLQDPYHNYEPLLPPRQLFQNDRCREYSLLFPNGKIAAKHSSVYGFHGFQVIHSCCRVMKRPRAPPGISTPLSVPEYLQAVANIRAKLLQTKASARAPP